ncbi:MAG: lysylphosphatidylglycerol synthase transmembrane domain-containing protein, partial [Candidatus Zixiibacteriota bacterium]
MTNKLKRKIYFVIGLLISVVLIWALFRNIETSLLLAALKQANYWWFLPMVIVIALTMYQRAFRWNVMLQPIKKVKFSNLLAATCIGFMANNVLPLRMGEFVRAYSLATQDKELTKSASLATIFVERMVFDLVALLVIFGGVLTFSSSLKDHIDQKTIYGLYISIGFAIVGLVSMILLAVNPKKVGELLARYLFFLPETTKEFIKGIVLRFSRGLEFLRDFKAVVSVTIQTLLVWMVLGASNYFVFAAFDFNLPLDAAFVLLVIVSISILLPSSPGFVGVYHVGVVWSLAVYG